MSVCDLGGLVDVLQLIIIECQLLTKHYFRL